ncbi:MAG TPA: VWA domain-containing protein [Candidatus Acidoferrales bacterium]
MPAYRTLLGIAAAVALTVSLYAQQQQQPPPQDPGVTIRAGVELVNVLATVRDGKRQLVPNLEKEEFRVFEDNKEQKIDFFTREVNMPITLGLAIDTSISQEGVLYEEQEAATRFLKRVMKPGDLTFVVSFDVNVDLLGDFSEDPSRIETAIARARINAPSTLGPVSRGGAAGTRLYDAVVLACQDKLAREAGRKVLILLTDGVDAGSHYEMKKAIEIAQQTNTVIHSIVISDPNFYRGGFTSGDAVARKLAEETGGRALYVRDPRKLDEAFQQIEEEVRSQYVLGYYPSNRSRDGKYRKLKVQSTRKGMRILTRKGYYAPKD